MSAADQAAVNAAVQQIIGAQKAPIQQAQTTFDKQAADQQTAITGLTSALSQILGGIGPGVKQVYDDASARQAAFAKGFSDHLQSQMGQHAQTVSDFLSNVVGAPSSAVAGAAGKIAPAAPGGAPGSAASDVLYGIRGYIPASNLNEEGAAYTANADMLPSIAAAQGSGQIGKVQQAQRTQDAAFAQDLAKIAGTVPQLRSQLASQLFDQHMKQSALDLQAKALGLKTQETAFNEGATKTRLSIAQQNADTAATRAARTALQQDRTYGLALKRIGIQQKAAQRAALAAEYKLKNGGFTPHEIQAYTGKAYSIADDSFNGYSVTKGSTTTKYAAVDFKTAMNRMLRAGIPPSIAITELEKVGFSTPKTLATARTIGKSLFPDLTQLLLTGGK